MVPLQGPTGWQFLMSELPLYQRGRNPPPFPQEGASPRRTAKVVRGFTPETVGGSLGTQTGVSRD